jgi:hypothetical protein
MAPERRRLVRRARAAATVCASLLAAAPAALAAPPGPLTQLAADGGCITSTSPVPPFSPTPGCDNAGRQLLFSQPVAVSPDGGNVYAGSIDPNAPQQDPRGGGGLAIFGRSQPTGALTQLPGPDGCLRDASLPPADGCANDGRAVIIPTSIVASRDSRHVYSAQPNINAIAAFTRERPSGALDQLPGSAGCVDLPGPLHTPGCATGPGLGGVEWLAISPDGKHVYGAAFFALVAFSRDHGTGP